MLVLVALVEVPVSTPSTEWGVERPPRGFWGGRVDHIVKVPASNRAGAGGNRAVVEHPVVEILGLNRLASQRSLPGRPVREYGYSDRSRRSRHREAKKRKHCTGQKP